MKPDWKDAPKWANWLAMDADHAWYWFEDKPFLSQSRRIWGNPGGQCQWVEMEHVEAEHTLEPRP